MMIKNTLVTAFSTVLLLSSVAAAPAFAQDDGPVGTWNGVLERNGMQQPLAMRLSDEGGLWRGRVEIDGATSPVEKVSVDGNHVRFELPGQGVFDGTVSNDSLVGSVSGSDSPESFTLKRAEPESPYGDPIESQGP